MWRYKCKSHLISMGLGFVVGCLLTALSLSKDSAAIYSIFGDTIASFVQSNTYLVIACGGLSIAGLVNIVYVSQFVAEKLNINSIFLLIVIMFAPTVLLMIGVVLVVPSIIVCIYGIISLHTEENKAMQGHQDGLDSEFVRVYSIHHALKEDMKEVGESCRKNADKMTLIYGLGVVAIICITIAVDNFILLTILFIFYIAAFRFLLRYRSTTFLPITSLMYSKCDPEACISAIIYYSTKRGKVRLVQRNLIAQCLIYLDDPELAQDVLIGFSKKDQSSSLNYWAIMSYIYYLLKDEDGLIPCKEEASKIRMNFGGTGVIIQSGELRSIQNRIDLLNGDLNTCKKYYLDSLKNHTPLAFQLVDASYYIALISFVQEDYVVSKLYFEKVLEYGNQMNLVEKAKKYLSKIESLDIDESDSQEA